MNSARLGISLLVVTLPALLLPVARMGGHPRTWARVSAFSLGTGFVLLEVALIHAALPLIIFDVGGREAGNRMPKTWAATCSAGRPCLARFLVPWL